MDKIEVEKKIGELIYNHAKEMWAESQKCPICKGKGWYRIGDYEEPDSMTCPECNGSGVIE